MSAPCPALGETFRRTAGHLKRSVPCHCLNSRQHCCRPSQFSTSPGHHAVFRSLDTAQGDHSIADRRSCETLGCSRRLLATARQPDAKFTPRDHAMTLGRLEINYGARQVERHARNAATQVPMLGCSGTLRIFAMDRRKPYDRFGCSIFRGGHQKSGVEHSPGPAEDRVDAGTLLDEAGGLLCRSKTPNPVPLGPRPHRTGQDERRTRRCVPLQDRHGTSGREPV